MPLLYIVLLLSHFGQKRPLNALLNVNSVWALLVWVKNSTCPWRAGQLEWHQCCQSWVHTHSGGSTGGFGGRWNALDETRSKDHLRPALTESSGAAGKEEMDTYSLYQKVNYWWWCCRHWLLYRNHKCIIDWDLRVPLSLALIFPGCHSRYWAKNSPAASKAFSPESTIIKYVRRSADINHEFFIMIFWSMEV